MDKKINEYIESSVWAVNSRYYIDGKSLLIPSEIFQRADTEVIREKLEKYGKDNNYEYFDKHIKTFIKANIGRVNYLKEEAFEFVKKTASKFDEEKLVISFSGGKDSTVTADVVVKALSNPSLVHIFGNTTLEFPFTITYAERYREEHPQAIFFLQRMMNRYFMMFVKT